MAKMNQPDAKRQRVIFDNLIRKKHEDSMNLLPWVVEATKKKAEIDRSFVPYKDDEVEPQSMPKNDVKGLDMNISLVDAFVNAEVLLPQGEESEGYDERSNLVCVKTRLIG